jgi:hypothetical protein
MKFAPRLGVEISVENDDAIANDQETVKWYVLGSHIVQSFGQYSRIESLAFRACSFPSRTGKLVGRDRVA